MTARIGLSDRYRAAAAEKRVLARDRENPVAGGRVVIKRDIRAANNLGATFDAQLVPRTAVSIADDERTGVTPHATICHGHDAPALGIE